GGKLSWLPGTTKRRVLTKVGEVVWPAGRRDKRGPNRSGRDRIHSDSARAERLRQSLRECDERRLRHRVINEIGARIERLDGRRHDDRCAWLEVRDGCAGHPHRREQIGVEHPTNLLWRYRF